MFAYKHQSIFMLLCQSARFSGSGEKTTTDSESSGYNSTTPGSVPYPLVSESVVVTHPPQSAPPPRSAHTTHTPAGQFADPSRRSARLSRPARGGMRVAARRWCSASISSTRATMRVAHRVGGVGEVNSANWKPFEILCAVAPRCSCTACRQPGAGESVRPGRDDRGCRHDGRSLHNL